MLLETEIVISMMAVKEIFPKAFPTAISRALALVEAGIPPVVDWAMEADYGVCGPVVELIAQSSW